MRVLPVIDLMGGVVVRGVAGQRDEYREVESCVASDATPGGVATALVDRFGFDDIYVADLDAIAGRPPSIQSYAAIEDVGLKLVLDCGIGTVKGIADHIGDSGRTLVIGLESLQSCSELAELAALGSERMVFSLDMKHRKPLTRITEWSDENPLSIAGYAVEAGFKRLIALDLATVGVGGGPCIEDLCRQLRSNHPDVELISGGGIRQVDDVRALCAAGCDRVLVASSLHNGNLTWHDVQSIG